MLRDLIRSANTYSNGIAHKTARVLKDVVLNFPGLKIFTHE